MNKLVKATLGAGAAFALFAGAAFASSHYTLDGDATIVPTGNPGNAVQLRSDTDSVYGAVDYTIPAGTTFASLEMLSTDFMVEADDVCVGGSPRFQIRVAETGPADSDPTGDNIFVYFEPHEAGDPLCTPGTWISSGDLLSSGQTVDTTQLGGTFYQDYDAAVAEFGSVAVSGVSLVVDAGWAAGDSEQTVLFDNVNVDGDVTTFDDPVVTDPTTQDACKNGGWQDFGFRNQGQCIRFVNTGQDSR